MPESNAFVITQIATGLHALEAMLDQQLAYGRALIVAMFKQ